MPVFRPVPVSSGGLSTVLTAPGAFNATATGNAISMSWLSAPIPALVKGVRIWGQRVSEAADAYEPATWTMLSYLNTTNSSINYNYIWDSDPVNLRIAYVAIDNTVGPYSFVNNVSVVWGSTSMISLYSEDFSQAGTWALDSGVTVTNQGAGLGYLINFGAANKAFNQTIPTYALSGRNYTLYLEIKGTAAQTISYFSHEYTEVGTPGVLGATTQGNVTLGSGTASTNGFEEFAIARTPTGNTGRSIHFGLQTYNSATATSVTVRKFAIFQGSLTLAQCKAAYIASTGPGTARQEPVSATGPYTVTGWHHSDSTSVPTIEVKDALMTITGARLSGMTHIVRGNTNNPSVTMTNSRTWAQYPNALGVPRGYAVTMAYGTNLIFENNVIRSGRGIFYQYGRAATNVRVRYNIHRDVDARYTAAGGGYVRSSYSTIQNRPPGAPIGRTIGNFFQGQGSFDSLNPPQGIDIDRNEVIIRMGYGAGEDTASFIQCRGSATTPYFCRNNLFFNSAMPWDYIWHDTSNPSNLYNYNNILTTFNLTLTVGAAGAAISATSIPLASSLNLNAYSIPNGTVLTFTGGKTATVNGTQGGNLTSLTVTALAAALVSGDVATISNVQDGPGTYSGTAVMLSDGILTPTNVAGSYEKQGRWGRAENNITIGPSAIQSICQGGDMEIRNSLLVNTKRTYDGTITDSGNRDAFWQINSFNNSTTTALDAGSVARVIWQNNGINNGKGYFVSGGGILIGSGDGNTSLVYGNRPITGIVSYLDAVMMAHEWRKEATGLGLTIGPTS